MKRILCLAAAAALLLALTSCDREPTLQEIFESQYGNAYIYEDGEHGVLHNSGFVTTLHTDDARYIDRKDGSSRIDNALPYEIVPKALRYNMLEREPGRGSTNEYGSMELVYTLKNNSDSMISRYRLDDFISTEQYLNGEWYRCVTLLQAVIYERPQSVGYSVEPGGEVTLVRSFAFTHYNYDDPEELRAPDRGVIDGSRPDIYPDKYVNFPAGRYRIVHDVGGNNDFVSLEFDLVYEDGLCYLHVVEDE